MKNRRIAVIAFLLVAVLALGIGYADVLDTLKVGGTATITAESADLEFDENIHFSTVTTTNDTVDTYTMADENDKIILDAKSFAAAGDKVVYTITIQNDNAYDAKVTLNSTTFADGTGTNFTVETNWIGTESTPAYTQTIAKESSKTFTVTITLENQVIGQSTCSIVMDFDVEPIIPTT